ncbi:unnamed protein product [Trichobilharzia regenti]|nr:unnamed protein product [Trichobilharzia regenti]
MSFTIETLLKTDDALPSNKLNESVENSIDFNPEENLDHVEEYQCDSYLRHHHYPQRRHSSDSIEQQQHDERHSSHLSDNPQNELNISSNSCPPSLYSLQSTPPDMNRQLLSSSSPFQQVSPQSSSSSSSSSPVTSSSSTSLLSSTTATTTFLSSPHSNSMHNNSVSPNNDEKSSNVMTDNDYKSNSISPSSQQEKFEYLNLLKNVQHSHQNYSMIITTTTTTSTTTKQIYNHCKNVNKKSINYLNSNLNIKSSFHSDRHHSHNHHHSQQQQQQKHYIINPLRPRRLRTTFTTYQLHTLETAFLLNQYPDVAARDQLANQLNLSDGRVQVCSLIKPFYCYCFN